jgi:hypothetical protein
MQILTPPLPCSAWKYVYFLPVLVTCLFFMAPAEATGPEYQSYEQPAPESVLELDSTFDETPDTERQRRERRRQRRELLKQIFWDGADLMLSPRTYYLDRQREDNPDSAAWAAGGALTYRTGIYKDRLQLGTTLFTSQKLYGPNNRDGTLLLKKGQKSFSVLGEAYARIRLKGTMEFSGYRQKLNLPYVNAQDSRMVPNTFEAYLIGDPAHPRFNFIAGYVTKIK